MHMARPTSPYTSSSSDTDSIIANAPTGTALRRLYFKTAKTSKMSNSAAQNTKNSSVPKVMTMNSSCNSTINTSTESASTHLTNITTTTDTETCDSLDLGLCDARLIWQSTSNRSVNLSFFPHVPQRRRRWHHRAAWATVERESGRFIDPSGTSWLDNNGREWQKCQHHECERWLGRIHHAAFGRRRRQRPEWGDELIILYFAQLWSCIHMIYWYQLRYDDD